VVYLLDTNLLKYMVSWEKALKEIFVKIFEKREKLLILCNPLLYKGRNER
jgi:hypothetical protein